MGPGDMVVPQKRATNNGIPASMGLCRILKKIGTVPNLYEVERIDPNDPAYHLRRERCFIYPEDLVNKSGLRLVD